MLSLIHMAETNKEEVWTGQCDWLWQYLLSAKDFEVMVLIKLSKVSENANKSEQFHTNSTASAN